ncbi:MAG: SulP family inorganic anion transporter [Rubrivivax sp.]|nr:SulP family inorganic anion transporter [Rubrivivax sp.]
MSPVASPAQYRAAVRSRELLAGAVGSLSVLAVPLTLGLLAFASLGAAAVEVGVPAAFVAVALGGIVYAVSSRCAMPAAGPSSATALILAGLVAHGAAGPSPVPGSALGVADILVLCGAAVMLSGGLQVALALLGVARLSRFVPQPVLAGFMNGVGLMILLAQLPLLLGQAPGGATGMAAFAQAQPGAVLLGLLTAVGLWAAAWRWPRAPAMLVALLAGTALVAWLDHVAPTVAMGARIGALPHDLPAPVVLLGLLQDNGLERLHAHAAALAGTALVLALIGTLECGLNNLALDQQLDTRHDPRRELLAIGATNIVCGIFCSLPVVALRARAVAILQSGGQGRGAVVGGSVVLGGLYLVGGPLLAALPLPVLAGIMLVIAWLLIDRWTGTLLAQWWSGRRSHDLWTSLGVVAVVCVTTVWRGFGAGVALGVVLSILVFFTRMSRSLVRARATAVARPSRRIYPAAVETRLLELREQIAIFELEGALFFGSREKLSAEADTLPSTCRCLVLDLRRVATIDETGAVALQQLETRLRRRGVELLLAGLAADSVQAQALRSFGGSGPGWPDADRAVEAAEQRLLGGQSVVAEAPLAECSLLQGLSAVQCEAVAVRLQERRLAAGEALFAEGDPADCLYVLTRGSLSVVSQPGPDGRTQRYLSISPGMMLGETAMLDGGGRSANAVADSEATVHALTRQDLEALTVAEPELAARLYRNVAVHLSERLRSTGNAWRASMR